MEIYRRSWKVLKSNSFRGHGETVHNAFFDRNFKEEEK